MPTRNAPTRGAHDSAIHRKKSKNPGKKQVKRFFLLAERRIVRI